MCQMPIKNGRPFSDPKKNIFSPTKKIGEITPLNIVYTQEISNTEFQALLENGVVLSVFVGACFGNTEYDAIF